MRKNFTDKCRKSLASDLLAGEVVEASVLGEPEGSLLQQMSSGKRLGLAAWDAKKIREDRDPHAMASVVGRKRLMITRTNQRVLFHEVSATAKTKTQVLALGLDQVDLASARVKRKDYVLVRFNDESAQSFLCPHNQPVDQIGPLSEL